MTESLGSDLAETQLELPIYRSDRDGGSLENHSRVLFDIVDGIRSRCRPDFMVGVRRSAERFGVEFPEALEVAQRLIHGGKIDFLDMSLWDVFKKPADEPFRGRTLLSYFSELERGDVRLGVAGKVKGAAEARACLEAGVDFVVVGRAAILHRDFPNRAREDADFPAVDVPVSADYLRAEGPTTFTWITSAHGAATSPRSSLRPGSRSRVDAPASGVSSDRLDERCALESRVVSHVSRLR
ncbi:MAG: hypothetical protein HRU01_16665 [Myxococcales bacterium]|nr:hypothetical protein [Myxococcales bacterium]